MLYSSPLWGRKDLCPGCWVFCVLTAVSAFMFGNKSQLTTTASPKATLSPSEEPALISGSSVLLKCHPSGRAPRGA